MDENLIAVIAGNHREYLAWKAEQGYDTRRRAFYADGAYRLQGLNSVEIVRTGTWEQRTDLAEIEQMIRCFR